MKQPRAHSSTHRGHPSYWAFVGHRLSGLALALFLPVHFVVLGLALEQGQQLDRLLAFSDIGAVKFAETGLVALLALHLAFGLRLLALELLPWSEVRDARLAWIGWGGVLSVVVAAAFVVGAF